MSVLLVISSPLANGSLRAFDHMAFDRRSGQDEVGTTCNVLGGAMGSSGATVERPGDHVDFGSDSSRRLQA